jgi:sulfur carrier protein
MSEALTLTVHINKLPHTLPLDSTLADAVALAGVKPPFAAAVNLRFVPRGSYAQCKLHANDQIELIAPITGG